MIPPLYNPVPGYIHPPNWSRPSGNTDFRVTRTYAQHVAAGQHGIDFGNSACGAPVFAMLSGSVVFSGTVAGATVNGVPLGLANVIRINYVSPQGESFRHDYAHLADRLVQVGAHVSAGQLLGHVGKTGALACHLHAGALLNGVDLDFWPNLWQNRTGHAVSTDVRFRAAAGLGTTLAPIYATVDNAGRIRRASDNKDLGAYTANRPVRQPIVGAGYTIGGQSGNLWLPYQLDTWVAVAKPLLVIA